MADETTTEVIEVATTTTTETEPQETGEPAELGDAGKKVLDTERKQRKEAEKKTKELEARLADLERAQMSEQERAVAEAIERAKQETRTEYGGALAAAEVKAAAAGRLAPEQIETLLDTVDLTKFLLEDGKVDLERIASFIEGIAPKADDGAPRTPDLGQGARSTTPGLGSDPLLQALKNTVGAR